MAPKTSVKTAPWNSRGLLDYVDNDMLNPTFACSGWNRPEMKITMRPNEPFRKTLTLATSTRNKSSVTFIFECEDGMTYPMFVTDFFELVKTVDNVTPGVYDCEWIVKKRGQNYGIGLNT